MLFFTGSTYAAPAVECANAMGIALFVYDPWGRMTPVNPAAREVARGTDEIEREMERLRATPLPEPEEPPAWVRHLALNWAAWLAVVFVVGPVITVFDSDEQAENGMFAGAWWADLLTVLGFWLGAALLVALQVGMNKSRLDRTR